MEGIRNNIFFRYLYIVGTQARTLLYVVGDDGFWNRIEESVRE